MQFSVIIPAHNPRPDYLGRVLAALAAQTLPPAQWELVIVDNCSQPPLAPGLAQPGHPAGRVVREERVGLTAARLAGFAATRWEIIVLVDDDNELAPDYLAETLRLFAAQPKVGALGGRSRPEFEQSPEPWVREFDDLLACRDLGDTPLISQGLRNPATGRNEYPLFAPVGAGMALRRAAAQAWLADPAAGALPDRRGGELTSGGDNDIILTVLSAGWAVAYFPTLSLTHLIPSGRLERDYLARLNRGIARSWMQVLRKHGVNPWPPLAAWTVPLRQGKAWFSYRAWSGPVAFIRWQGACGHFEGRVACQSQ